MSKDLAGPRLINFTCERTSSNLWKQSVLDGENIHLKVMQYVLNCKTVPTEDLASKLLHLCYKFLVSLTWNYQPVKVALSAFVPRLTHHIVSNVGCIDFLKEMYDNNKGMLFNENAIVKLAKSICSVINAEPFESFYRSKLLDFFRFLLYCNGKCLKYNQINILKIMQDDSFSNLILNIILPEIHALVN